VRQGVVKKCVPQLLRVKTGVDHVQEMVEPRRHRQHFGQRCGRIDAFEQRHRQFRILPDVGGDTVFAHPARFLALDRRRHQPVGHDPPRDNQRRFPAEVEGIAPRLAPQRIAAADMLADAARRVLDNAVVGEMRKERRLPPRAPAIGAGFVAQEGSGGEFCVGVVAQG
jgi:hypothetical protein